MCITYSVLPYKLATGFSKFLIVILFSKNGNNCDFYIIFSVYWTLSSKQYPLSLSPK